MNALRLVSIIFLLFAMTGSAAASDLVTLGGTISFENNLRNSTLNTAPHHFTPPLAFQYP